MKPLFNRRQFAKAGALAGVSFRLPRRFLGSAKKSVLVFTKSSGFEHDVVKIKDGKPSIVDEAITSLGKKHGFDVTATKDGRIFDSNAFRKHSAILFYTTGDLTTPGTDKNPPMSPQGKEAMLKAIHGGVGFIGIHCGADTFHTQPDPEDNSNRYVAHADKSDPYIRMLGGEFITHGSTPRLQTANIIVNDPKFPGLQGVASQFSFNDEWYSLKDFRSDLHVILTLDTKGMSGKPYQRPPYPMTWARMEGRGRIFYTAIGDRPENWSSALFLNLLAGGIRWAIGDATATTTANLQQVAPGSNAIPPK